MANWRSPDFVSCNILERVVYLSTVLEDFSRYILAWKLCSTMTAADSG